MYNVSQAFKNAIKQPSRMISAKIEIEDRTYFDEHIIDLSYEDTSNPSTNFEIGSTSSASINLSLMDVNEVFETLSIKPFIGLDVNGAVEYVPLGVFYADQVERKKNVVSLTLFDGMIKLEQAYFSNLTYPTTIINVMNEICNKVGIQFSGTLPNYEIKMKPEGYTYREMVGYIAQLCGGFAKFNRDGKLTIKSYAAASDSYNSDHYIDYNKKKDRPYRIDKLSVQVGESILSKGALSAGGSEVRFENPFMTDAILTDVYNKLNGFTYLPTWVKLQGNPALECGDIITLTTIDSEIIQIPIMKHKLSYQGGLIGEIESEGESENQNTFSSSGSMSRKVERVVYEQALINEALINKANIDDLEATNARIDNLKVSTAMINDLAVTSAKIAKSAISTAHIQEAAITEALIAEGAVGDLQVSRLSANKLDSGTIDTAKVTIASPNGRMQLSGNKLQIFDLTPEVQLYERIMLGIDDLGNSALVLRGADGQTVLLNQDGLTDAGFTDGYNKLQDNSLDPAKIDISKVVTRINEGTTQIIGSKILIDNESLDVKFTNLTQTVTEHGETLTSHYSAIQENAQQIQARVTRTEFDSITEDIQSQLDTKATTENVEGQIETVVAQYQADLQILADEINLSVDGKIVDTEERLTTQIKTEIDASLEGITFNLSEITSQVTDHGTEIEKLNSYFAFTTDGLNIGKSDSPLNISISNEQIDFKDNGVVVSYVNGQKMYITQAEITESLIVGVHKIEKYDNQRTLIRWVGE